MTPEKSPFDTTGFNENDEVCNYPNCNARTTRTTNAWKNVFCLKHMLLFRGSNNQVVFKKIKEVLFLERQRLAKEVEKIIDKEFEGCVPPHKNCEIHWRNLKQKLGLQK